MISTTQPIVTSAEVRWFFEGTLSQEIDQWFSASDFVSKLEIRDDSYLVFPQSISVGVKFRDGKLEIKSKVKSLGVRTYPSDVIGHVQVWDKWSYGDKESKSLLMQLQQMLTKYTKVWVTVKKERKLRKISMDQGNPFEVAPESRPHNGCNFELTKIVANHMRYWSIGFEAFGDPAKVEESLDKVVEHVLTNASIPISDAPKTILSANYSHSYPEWLGLLQPNIATDR
ncbi:MAG: hypothetical protein H0X47_04560 [Nitrospirales bacterium]|nr:hypothetical protein [Nitrospirales bacterium]